MFDLSLFIAFVLAASILTITPGLDTALILRASLAPRVSVAILTLLGIVAGCLVWGLLVSVGLGVVILASDQLYYFIKLGGAIYLLWLGGNFLLRPRKDIFKQNLSAKRMLRDAFWQGMMTNLLNPKVGVFYLSFIPQFIPKGADVPLYSFGLAAVHAGLTWLWLFVLIIAASTMKPWLSRGKTISMLDRLTGGVLIAFGCKVIFSRN